MTISFRAAGTVSGNTLTPSPSYPAGVISTDINILQVVAKPNSGVIPQNVTCATPAGWTLLLAASSGNQAPGTPEGSSGSANTWIFTRTGGAFTGSVPLTLTNHSVASAAIDTYASTAGGGWNTSTSYGYDNDSSGLSYDSNRTVTSTNLNITTGDWMLVRSGLTNTSGVGTVAVTATGAVLSAATQRHSQVSTVTTPDTSNSWIDARDVTVTSGTSTAGPKMTATTVQDGISVFVLLREGIRAISGAETVSSVDKSSLGASDDMPVTKAWVNGDELSAANLNAHFRDPIAWLLTESPGIQLEATTPVTFNTTTHTITWNTTPRYRRGSIVVSGTKVIVPTTGYYIGEFSVGVKDQGTMGLGWLLTVDVLMYPGGTGAATVQNISANFTDMDVEVPFSPGSAPISFFLNQGDAIEVKMSGGWNTAGGAGLWADGQASSVQIMLDLHWNGFWAGGVV